MFIIFLKLINHHAYTLHHGNSIPQSNYPHCGLRRTTTVMIFFVKGGGIKNHMVYECPMCNFSTVHLKCGWNSKHVQQYDQIGGPSVCGGPNSFISVTP